MTRARDLAGFSSAIGLPNDNLIVGIVTATQFSGPLTGDITGNITGNVTGILTTPSAGVTVNDSGINASGIVTASSFVGDGINLSNTGAELDAASGTQRVVLTSLTSGTMTAVGTTTGITFEASSNTLTVAEISASDYEGNFVLDSFLFN